MFSWKPFRKSCELRNRAHLSTLNVKPEIMKSIELQNFVEHRRDLAVLTYNAD